MKFALVASVAVCCLSAVLAGPLGDPDTVETAFRSSILNNYCNNIAVTSVINIRTFPQILKPLSCIATSFIDGLCLTTYAEEFCTNPFNDDEGGNDGDLDDFDDDTGDNEDQGSTPGTDVEDPNTTITTTLTPGDVEANPTGDDEARVSTPGTDAEDPNTTITTTLTPGDAEANRNPNAKSKPGTKSKTSKKSKGSNKKSKKTKGKSAGSHHAKSKGKNAHGNSNH